jgi:hypothetical protein
MEAVAYQLDQVIQQLFSGTASTVNEVSLVGDWEVNHAVENTYLKPPTEA